MNTTLLRSEYGVDATEAMALRENVALIQTPTTGKVIFKCVRNAAKGNAVNYHRFKNELRIYKALQKANFRYLNTPKLLQWGSRYMIMEYIEKKPVERLAEAEFAKAYLDLQALQVPLESWFDFKNQLSRGFFYKGILIPLFTVSKYVGFKTTASIISLFLKLQLQSKKTSERYWLHGDLTGKNFYYNQADGQLYFIDFEIMTYTRKWPLLEIVQRCVWLKDDECAFYIDLHSLKYYLQQAEKMLKDDLTGLNLKSQFRFSLLITCIAKVAKAKSKIKTKAFKTLLHIVLSESQFNKWYGSYVEPALKDPDTGVRRFEIKDSFKK